MTSTESIICVMGKTSEPSVTDSANEYSSFNSILSVTGRGAENSADVSATSEPTATYLTRLRAAIQNRTAKYISAKSSLAVTPASAPATAYLTP